MALGALELLPFEFLFFNLHQFTGAEVIWNCEYYAMKILLDIVDEDYVVVSTSGKDEARDPGSDLDICKSFFGDASLLT